jgi:hypothetical protein
LAVRVEGGNVLIGKMVMLKNRIIMCLNYLERWDEVMWTGLVWLRIGTGGELL